MAWRRRQPCFSPTPTYGALVWRDTAGNLYAVASALIGTSFVAAAATPLGAQITGVDLAAASRAQALVRIATPNWKAELPPHCTPWSRASPSIRMPHWLCWACRRQSLPERIAARIAGGVLLTIPPPPLACVGRAPYGLTKREKSIISSSLRKVWRRSTSSRLIL